MRVRPDGHFEGLHRRGEAGETREPAAVRGQQAGLAGPHIIRGKRHQRIGLTERRCHASQRISTFEEKDRRNGAPRRRLDADPIRQRGTGDCLFAFVVPFALQVRLQPRHHLRGAVAMNFEVSRQAPAGRPRTGHADDHQVVGAQAKAAVAKRQDWPVRRSTGSAPSRRHSRLPPTTSRASPEPASFAFPLEALQVVMLTIAAKIR